MGPSSPSRGVRQGHAANTSEGRSFDDPRLRSLEQRASMELAAAADAAEQVRRASRQAAWSRRAWTCLCWVVVVLLCIALAGASWPKPRLSIQGLSLRDLHLGEPLTIKVDVSMQLSNPDRWGPRVKCLNFTADVSSLDKETADGVGEELYLGRAFLPDALAVQPASTAQFVLHLDSAVDLAVMAPALQRLVRDCGPLAAARETRMRTRVVDAKVAVLGMGLPVPEVVLDELVGCGAFGMPANSPSSSPRPSLGLGDPPPVPGLAFPPPLLPTQTVRAVAGTLNLQL